jgi:hypothetical protein
MNIGDVSRIIEVVQVESKERALFI